MFSCLFFVCLVAKITSTSCSIVDVAANNSAVPQPQNDVPPHAEVSLLIKMQQKIEELEKKQVSLEKEIGFLRDNTERMHPVVVKRKRRDGRTVQSLTEGTECVPGTNGCPVSVTPFSIAGSCILCPTGPRGYPGPVGPPGRDGRDAITIITNPGNVGTPEEEETNRPTPIPPISGHASITPPSNTSGAVYIRWGHHSCPATSLLIYTGSAAAPHYGAAGNGADQLCLPGDPIYDEPVSGVGGSRAFLYGLEYQIDSFPTHNNRLWHDVPCAVCKAPHRFAKLMIPGKNICPDEDWTLEYGGYLMAERNHNNHKRSLHICVDREMETIRRTAGAAGGSIRGLLDLVEGRCSASGGGIPCGPYTDGYEITCAVCTQ